MTPYYRPATLDDIDDLAPRIRLADVEEVYAIAKIGMHQALTMSFHDSLEVNSIVAPDGEVIGMFGVTDSQDPLLFSVWMLCSDRLPEISRPFLRQSKEWVKKKNASYPILYNYVDARNTKAIQWLKYLGFVFVQRMDNFGFGRKTFYEFVRI